MRKLRVGEKAPDFKLPGVDGKNHTLANLTNGHKAIVLVFACNHCPYSQAYENRLIALQDEYGHKGVQVVAVNPNDASSYPQDSFEQMKVRASKKHFNYPYLRDELQVIAHAYGAEYTPEIYLLDDTLTLRYNGRIDDNWHDGREAKSHDLRRALNELLAGKPVSHPLSHGIGCSVKWKF